ncbi:hypothetical protein EEB14_54505 [Rhodococcus sp. WS4]|nr:hypothetical protein EEB14_54505 [Rhodococcus sp. WS4]
MGSDIGGRAFPGARLAGHLLALVTDHDFDALSAQLRPLVQPPAAGPVRGALYGGVLTWLVTALTDVVTARLGQPEPGESFVLELQTTRGRTLGAEDLPPREGRVGRAALALLSGDPGTARVHLGAAEREPDPAIRVSTLVEALVWLDALLAADTPAFPDCPPR